MSVAICRAHCRCTAGAADTRAILSTLFPLSFTASTTLPLSSNMEAAALRAAQIRSFSLFACSSAPLLVPLPFPSLAFSSRPPHSFRSLCVFILFVQYSTRRRPAFCRRANCTTARPCSSASRPCWPHCKAAPTLLPVHMRRVSTHTAAWQRHPRLNDALRAGTPMRCAISPTRSRARAPPPPLPPPTPPPSPTVAPILPYRPKRPKPPRPARPCRRWRTSPRSTHPTSRWPRTSRSGTEWPPRSSASRGNSSESRPSWRIWQRRRNIRASCQRRNRHERERLRRTSKPVETFFSRPGCHFRFLFSTAPSLLSHSSCCVTAVMAGRLAML